jgi:hypothetical protein
LLLELELELEELDDWELPELLEPEEELLEPELDPPSLPPCCPKSRSGTQNVRRTASAARRIPHLR